MSSSKLRLKSYIWNLPDEVLTEVLLRLRAPAKMYTRLRLVSKSWKTLIDSPEFRQAFGTMNSLIYYANSGTVYLARPGYMDSPESMMPDGSEIETEGMKVMGSCNGLLCLSDSDGDCSHARFVVMNPSTKQSAELPEPENRYQYPIGNGIGFGGTGIGFGYDNVNDDYKVVRLANHHQLGILANFNVCMYSFRANCWRDVTKPELTRHHKYSLEPPNWGVLANGALHWIVCELLICPHVIQMSRSMLAFDLANEKCDIITLPCCVRENIRSSDDVEHGFGEVDGCLTLLLTNDESCACDVWMMKKYGVSGSWTKLSLRLPNMNLENLQRLRNIHKWGHLFRYNFDARSVLEPTTLASDDCFVFRNQGKGDDDLILRKPPMEDWNMVFTFTPNFAALPLQN